VLHVLDHSYAHLLSPHRARPAVVTVHDLIPLLTVRRRPTGLRDRIRNFVLERVLEAMRRADRWIVSTEWLRGELAEWLGEEHRIDVIPYGVDDGYFSPPDGSRAELRGGLGVPDDRFLVLHVGSVVERKNVPGVLAAVDGLRARKVPVWLLQVGGRFTSGQREEIAARGLEDAVTQLPEAAEADLRGAYRAADVLLFPSHYEGFGLPVLEAMASELPIVTSAAPALAEVAGDAAVVIDSRDPTLYVDALQRIATDRAWADELRRRGRARARAFTWSETARRTGEVYRRLA
jgi:glycosyltransferase involved in cell wall biosynthesis